MNTKKLSHQINLNWWTVWRVRVPSGFFMEFDSKASLGLARLGAAWLGKAGRGLAWQGYHKARHFYFFKLGTNYDNDKIRTRHKGFIMQDSNNKRNNAGDVRPLSGRQRHAIDAKSEALSWFRRRNSYSTLDQLNEFPLGEEYRQRTEAAARLPKV